jgi:hypothetical protein
MTTRQLAQSAHERFRALVMRTHLDWCANIYGLNNGTTSFCTATGAVGSECYQTYGSCQDKLHYVKGSKQRSYCLRGMDIPPGETLRPYITGSPALNPPELPIGGGLAVRSNFTITLTDEACSDVEDDPYFATRAAPAQGSYQTRLLARNYNYAGRHAEILDGYVTDPFDWTVFQTSLYLIDKIAGPASDGSIEYTLSDLVKLLDTNMLPQATTGTLQADFKAIEYTGTVVSADATHVVLAAAASALDNAYLGMEFYIAQNTGSGQRQLCTGYVGATRQAAFGAAWLVIPDGTSIVEVTAVAINVGAGNGVQYNDPAVTGNQEFFCIGKEEIRYTAIAGDVLSWPDSTYRAQWGTPREDHKANDGVSQVLAFVDKSASYVAQFLLNAGGLADAYIDLAGLAQEDADWLGSSVHITASIASKPEKTSGLLDEFLKDMNMASWWDPVGQLQRFKCDMPELAALMKSITPSETVSQTMVITPLDQLRMTQLALHFAPYSATEPMTSDTNFSITEDFIESNAESPNEYAGVVKAQRYSRWLTAGNAGYVRALVSRQIYRLRDAPWNAEFEIDPRDEVGLADLIDVATRKKTDFTGAPLTVPMRVTRLTQQGNFQVKAVNISNASRMGFIAPDGTPDYPADSTYAHISDASGLMSDGTPGFTII